MQDEQSVVPVQTVPEKKHPAPTFLQTVVAVLWSFFGVRQRAAHERDLAALKPLHIIVIGILIAALFIGVLLILVRVAIHQFSAI